VVFFGTELFVDMTVLPSLLPSRREAGQTKHALDMLSQCFRHAYLPCHVLVISTILVFLFFKNLPGIYSLLQAFTKSKYNNVTAVFCNLCLSGFQL
jgi:hypothetical protein